MTLLITIINYFFFYTCVLYIRLYICRLDFTFVFFHQTLCITFLLRFWKKWTYFQKMGSPDDWCRRALPVSSFAVTICYNVTHHFSNLIVHTRDTGCNACYCIFCISMQLWWKPACLFCKAYVLFGTYTQNTKKLKSFLFSCKRIKFANLPFHINVVNSKRLCCCWPQNVGHCRPNRPNPLQS